MTPSELKYQHETKNPESHYFTRDTMKHFGDRMKNYGVRELPDCFELYRKRPVNGGLQTSAYFDKVTFKRIASRVQYVD